MPKRISFNVVYATSEDQSYPACELNSQGPASVGWRSSGRPPHELLLRLSSATNIHQIQLLAHHQLVPASVEVLVTGGIEIEGAQTPCGAAYVSIGHILLAEPQDHASTRELRSASLPEPTVARFVKLKMSPPHKPDKEDDQIALMAVNILGDEIDLKDPLKHSKEVSPYDDLSFVMYVDVEIADVIRRLDERKKVAIAEERFEYARRLKNAIASLNGVGLRIGRWRLRQRTAALQAKYEIATEARDRITAALESIMDDEELILLFEVDGPEEQNNTLLEMEYDFSHHLNTAVVCVNYTTSFEVPTPRIVGDVDASDTFNALAPTPMQEQPKRTDEPLAATTHNSNIEQNLNLELKVKVEKIEEFVDSLEDIATHVESVASQDALDGTEDKKAVPATRRSLTPSSCSGNSNGIRKRNKSAGPRTSFEDYEETPLPTLKHSQTNEYLKEYQNEDCGNSIISGSSSTANRVQPHHRLNERERKINSLAILIFGETLVEKFYSKNYLEKEEGLLQLKAELTSSDAIEQKSNPNKTARAASILLQRPLKDKVFSVFSLANEAVKILFQEYVVKRGCASSEVGRCLDRLLPELMKATGDPVPRVASTAQHTILTLADCPPVRSLHTIPQMLIRPMAPSTHPRLALAKLIMLEQLIQTPGISSDKQSGLTARRIAEAGAVGINAGGAAREVAERVLLVAYARAPRLVRAQLPPDDAVTRRNLIYRHLFHQFDRIDMEKLLSQAPSESKPSDKSLEDSVHSILETGSMTQSSYSCLTSSMSRMTSSIGRMTSSMSISTLAPSTASSATSKTRSSLKQTPTRKTPSRGGRDGIPFYGFNKLKIDSAASPKHSRRNSGEKVHFEEPPKEEVKLRRSNRNSNANRHSIIHYDHSTKKSSIKERPKSSYEPMSRFDKEVSHFYDKNNCKSLESINSPKAIDTSRIRELFANESSKQRGSLYGEEGDALAGSCVEEEMYKSLDSCKLRTKYSGHQSLESPGRSVYLDNNLSRSVMLIEDDSKAKSTRNIPMDRFNKPLEPECGRVEGVGHGRRSLRLEDGQMDESGYYSPGEKTGKTMARSRSQNLSDINDGYDGSVDVSSGNNTPEPNNYSTNCEWCGRSVRTAALESHRVKRCVILATCPQCATTTHARHLHSHLLEECDRASDWHRCSGCGAALRGDEGCYHARCNPSGADEWKCPYCLLNVIARDEPWQRHLSRCPRNPRVFTSRS